MGDMCADVAVTAPEVAAAGRTSAVAARTPASTRETRFMESRVPQVGGLVHGVGKNAVDSSPQAVVLTYQKEQAGEVESEGEADD